MVKIGGDQGWHEEIVELLEKKGVRILRFFLRCLTRPSLRHEKHRSFLFRRLDLLNRTDPGEEVRNAGYNCMRHTVICTRGSCREQEFELAGSGPQLLLSHSLTAWPLIWNPCSCTLRDVRYARAPKDTASVGSRYLWAMYTKFRGKTPWFLYHARLMMPKWKHNSTFELRSRIVFWNISFSKDHHEKIVAKTLRKRCFYLRTEDYLDSYTDIN